MKNATSEPTVDGDGAVGARAVRTCLVFNDRADEAVKFYVSLFKNSRIVEAVYSDGSSLIPKGKLVSAIFELDGREYRAFDGGPTFNFSEGISMDVVCDTQEQIDHLWRRLLRDIVRHILPSPRRNRTNPRVVKRKMSNFKLKRPEHRSLPQPSQPFSEVVVVLPMPLPVLI